MDTAYVAARSGIDVEQVSREVAGVIGHEGILRLLSNLGQIAQADGHLELREARMIGRIRAALHRADECDTSRLTARTASGDGGPRSVGRGRSMVTSRTPGSGV